MKKIFKIFIFFILIAVFLLAFLYCYFFLGKTGISNSITWGIDFSQMQAEALNLEWRELYNDIIYDLHAKNIKLHTQWDWVEGERDDYFFNDIDWQIKQAEQNNVNIIYVLGMKTGRWPECHIPAWGRNLSQNQAEEELLEYIKKVVERYRDSKSIVYWQVENEPLFKFGECPNWYYKNDELLKKEVKLVKMLDPSRKIIISDSGEQSSWFGPAKIGDIVGITMYRKVWAHITNDFGFSIYSFLNPVTYYRKAEIIKKMFNKDVICIELQAEPWVSRLFYDVPLEEQEKSMNLAMFKENIEFAKLTGLDTFYFWGVEWWYWMKERQNKPEIWNEAKNIFNN